MPTVERLVVDTNVLVSGIVLPLSLPQRTVDKALDHGVLLFSEATMSELAEVLSRPKFDHYVSIEERMLFLAELARTAELVPIIQVVRECRDSNDDKCLEVVLNGRAAVIITGDADLLALHPWRDIAILSPTDYLRH